VRTGTPTFGTNYSSGVDYKLGNIATGPDGNLWFTVLGKTWDEIGKMSPTTGYVFHRWIVIGDANNDVAPDIVAGRDGNMWFTMTNCNEVGRITTSGSVKTFSIPFRANDAGSNPDDITAAYDGSVWFTEPCPGRIPLRRAGQGARLSCLGHLATRGDGAELPVRV
jgi:streptogramin lyase